MCFACDARRAAAAKTLQVMESQSLRIQQPKCAMCNATFLSLMEQASSYASPGCPASSSCFYFSLHPAAKVARLRPAVVSPAPSVPSQTLAVPQRLWEAELIVQVVVGSRTAKILGLSGAPTVN